MTTYKGVIIYVRVKEGRVKVGDNIRAYGYR